MHNPTLNTWNFLTDIFKSVYTEASVRLGMNCTHLEAVSQQQEVSHPFIKSRLALIDKLAGFLAY